LCASSVEMFGMIKNIYPHIPYDLSSLPSDATFLYRVSKTASKEFREINL